MPQRRRATSEFEATQSEAGPRTVTLDSLVGGYNGYTSPDLLTPQFWAASSQVYAGQFGTIRRARWAPVVNTSTTGYPSPTFLRFISMFGYAPFGLSPFVLMQFTGSFPNLWTYGGSFTSVPINFFISGAVSANPLMYLGLQAFILFTNGQFRAKLLFGTPVYELWGLDAPDVSAAITLNAGTTGTIVGATGAVRAGNIVTITLTAPLPANFVPGAYVNIAGVTDTTFNSATGTAFQILTTATPSFTYAQVGAPSTSGSGTATVQITKTVGRSYQYAWENNVTTHVSAPSPASQFVKYTNQTGTIDALETGTVTIAFGGFVTGTGTNFSTAWVGRALWVEGAAGVVSSYLIEIVSSPTALQISGIATLAGNHRFQVVDPQMTNVKLYATGDGQPVYFLIARNAFLFSGSTALAAGLEFTDTANSEPPNPPFSSEITQIYNVPPPIGTFIQDYQGRVLVYGVPGALQTFFYSNIEATVVGQPPESFSPLNTVALPLGDGQLNGMSNLPTGLIIWSNRQDMFKLTGLLSDNTIASSAQLGATIQRLPYKIGCASPYATAVTPLGAIWLSSDREVWLFTDHYAPKNVGKPVQDVLNRINGARLSFSRMSFYKRGDRSWLALAVSLDASTFNNKLLLLDLDLLASNGQPSYFTFDMATNAPTWYQYDVSCEAITTAYDSTSTNHLLASDIDLVRDLDWQPAYYTVGAEQNIPTPGVTLHAFGNEDPHMIKTFEWMRALTNQVPNNLASQGWAWAVNAFDDDRYVIGVNPLTTNLIPGVDSNSNPLFLEYSPAKFKFGGFRPVKGRRFQIGTTFPSTPGLFELRGFEVQYTNIVGR
jgi:hypothetical protein